MLKFIASLFPNRLRREVKELYLSTIAINLGTSMLIFEPIFLYEVGYSLVWIMYFYLLVYILYFIFMPIGAKYAAKNGVEKSIVLSTFFIVALYLTLYNIRAHELMFYLAVVFYTLEKMYYWPAYHVDFANHTRIGERAREISGLTAATAVTNVLGPLIAGFLILYFGFQAMFIAVAALFLLSNIPLLSSKEKFTPSKFSALKSFKKVFSKKFRRPFFAYFGYAEEYVALVVLPIFIYVMINNNFEVGVIISASVLLSVFVTMLAGKWSDWHHEQGTLRLGTALYSFSWLIFTIVKTAFGVFLVRSLSMVGKNIINVPMTAITYDRARKEGVLEYIVAFESALVIGKLAMIVFLMLLFYFLTDLALAFDISFIAAAVTSLLYLLL